MTPRAKGRELVQEQRVRRVAKRRGYMVSKSKRRDPLATDYGSWQLIRGDEVLLTGTIDQIEHALNSPPSGR